MFDKKLLESTEFYSRRYQNFATLIILPVFLALTVLLIFSICTTRELTIKANGQIVPNKVIAIVQSTSNNDIQNNQLTEGRTEKKGAVLLTYKNSNDKNNNKLFSAQIDQGNDRLNALDLFKKSIVNGSSQFKKPDVFGYSEMFNNYLEQIATLNDDYEQQANDKAVENKQEVNQTTTLNGVISKSEDQVGQYESVINAVQGPNDADLRDNQYAYIYDNYLMQIKGLTESEKNNVKQDTIGTLQQSIEQLKGSIDNYQVQKSAISTDAPYLKDSTNDKIMSLKESQLAEVDKEYANEENDINKLKAQKRVIGSELESDTVKANQSGILHTLTSKMNPRFISKGTEVAEIYPELSKNPKLDAEFLIPASSVSALKMGSKIRFRISEKISKPIIIDGEINRIDTTATSLKQGNFFKIDARINLTKKDYHQIKYGSEGQVTVIVGKKTWFNYVKDNLFKIEGN